MQVKEYDLMNVAVMKNQKPKLTTMKYLQLFSVLLIIGIASCKKGDNIDNIAPTDLVVTATVSNDSSGTVAFTATAKNAVSYEYDFGNGFSLTVLSGLTNYKYAASGTYTVTVTASSTSGQTISKTLQVTVTVVLKLKWSDEFEVDGPPDPSKWGYDLGAGGWGNAELQNYTNRTDNSIVSNGTLKITAKSESYNGSPYTSARLLTKDKFSFKYGKVEASAKLPEGVGTWAAIWMLGDNITTVGWPACGEIDIMEHLGRQLNKIYGTLHHPGHSGGNGDGSTTTISNATTEFHKYSVEWSTANIKISVDDVVFYNFINAGNLPFNHNFFIILNIAMGGNFGGAVDPAFTSGVMEIDYVRVYQ
ncbi:MAG TPA: family 16 glycosylhydrolase [Chitinophagaceae bacterium]|nr:family 16 glycosylhydrolase [Chitinophagaceae bacterium]